MVEVYMAARLIVLLLLPEPERVCCNGCRRAGDDDDDDGDEVEAENEGFLDVMVLLVVGPSLLSHRVYCQSEMVSSQASFLSFNQSTRSTKHAAINTESLRLSSMREAEDGIHDDVIGQ